MTNFPLSIRSRTRYFKAAPAPRPCRLAEYDATSIGNSASSPKVRLAASMTTARWHAWSSPTPPPASAR